MITGCFPGAATGSPIPVLELNPVPPASPRRPRGHLSRTFLSNRICLATAIASHREWDVEQSRARSDPTDAVLPDEFPVNLEDHAGSGRNGDLRALRIGQLGFPIQPGGPAQLPRSSRPSSARASATPKRVTPAPRDADVARSKSNLVTILWR